jgi:hypothetical protein
LQNMLNTMMNKISFFIFINFLVNATLRFDTTKFGQN